MPLKRAKPQNVDERAVLREFTRRFGDVSDLGGPEQTPDRTFRFREDLFEQQIDFIDHPSKLKVACCSRRAGKSTAAAMYLIEQCLRHPESLCVYLATSRMAAKRILWLLLKQLSRKYDLKLRFQNTDLVCHFNNGSRIELHGCSDAGDLDRLRGNKFRLVVVDEAGHFTSILDELVQETIAPGCIDLDGTICLIGTPSMRCTGLFFNAYHDDRLGYQKFHWTLHDNPYLNKKPGATKKWIEDRMHQTGMTQESAIYQREWCGKFVRSDDSLVYKYTNKNFYEQLDQNFDWNFICGTDLGWHDASSVAVVAYSLEQPSVYLVDCWAESKLLPSQLAERLAKLHSEYNFTSIQMDTAGMGKAIAEEMRARFALPIKAAKKTEKFAAIELLNSDLQCGNFFIHQESPICEEWDQLQWTKDFKKEHPAYPNHISDATLYAFREARHYAWRQRVDIPALGTPERQEWELDRYWASRSDKISSKEGEGWWENQWTFQ